LFSSNCTHFQVSQAYMFKTNRLFSSVILKKLHKI